MAERSYPCPTCGKVLTRPAILKAHLRSHANERPYQCRKCDKSFNWPSDYKQHQAIHDEEPRHICQWRNDSDQLVGWGRPFRRKEDLKRHQRRAGASKCGESFVVESSRAVETPAHQMPVDHVQRDEVPLDNAAYKDDDFSVRKNQCMASRSRASNDAFAVYTGSVSHYTGTRTVSGSPSATSASGWMHPNAHDTRKRIQDVSHRYTLTASQNLELYDQGLIWRQLAGAVSTYHQGEILWRVSLVVNFVLAQRALKTQIQPANRDLRVEWEFEL